MRISERNNNIKDKIANFFQMKDSKPSPKHDKQHSENIEGADFENYNFVKEKVI
jgi:hypothetical protein